MPPRSTVAVATLAVELNRALRRAQHAPSSLTHMPVAPVVPYFDELELARAPASAAVDATVDTVHPSLG